MTMRRVSILLLLFLVSCTTPTIDPQDSDYFFDEVSSGSCVVTDQGIVTSSGTRVAEFINSYTRGLYISDMKDGKDDNILKNMKILKTEEVTVSIDGKDKKIKAIACKDNCPLIRNDQEDKDRDGIGDACPPATVPALPADPSVPVSTDTDKDGIEDGKDNCPWLYNPGQSDLTKQACEDDPDKDTYRTGDGQTNRQNNCRSVIENEGRTALIYRRNTDHYVAKITDVMRFTESLDKRDFKAALPHIKVSQKSGDTWTDKPCEGNCPTGNHHHWAECNDNCPTDPNFLQEDDDNDGVGNACDDCLDTEEGATVDENGCAPEQLAPAEPEVPFPDEDGDLYPNYNDNCPKHPNPKNPDWDVERTELFNWQMDIAITQPLPDGVILEDGELIYLDIEYTEEPAWIYMNLDFDNSMSYAGYWGSRPPSSDVYQGPIEKYPGTGIFAYTLYLIPHESLKGVPISKITLESDSGIVKWNRFGTGFWDAGDICDDDKDVLKRTPADQPPATPPEESTVQSATGLEDWIKEKYPKADACDVDAFNKARSKMHGGKIIYKELIDVDSLTGGDLRPGETACSQGNEVIYMCTLDRTNTDNPSTLPFLGIGIPGEGDFPDTFVNEDSNLIRGKPRNYNGNCHSYGMKCIMDSGLARCSCDMSTKVNIYDDMPFEVQTGGTYAANDIDALKEQQSALARLGYSVGPKMYQAAQDRYASSSYRWDVTCPSYCQLLTPEGKIININIGTYACGKIPVDKQIEKDGHIDATEALYFCAMGETGAELRMYQACSDVYSGSVPSVLTGVGSCMASDGSEFGTVGVLMTPLPGHPLPPRCMLKS